MDTLVETQNFDLGLFGNTFVAGTAYDNTGTVGYAASAGALESESDLATAMGAVEDPSFPPPGYGEQWGASSVVENTKGMFSTAILTGGNGNNTMVVNDIDSTIYVGGVARSVSTWSGHAILDDGANTSNTLPEYYVITLKPGTTLTQVDINDSGGASGTNDVVVFGSNQADTIELNSAGSGAFAVGFVTATVSSLTDITFEGVQRLEVYLLGGNDNVLSNDTAVTTIIDMGSGDDSIVVGTVPLVPDPGNRTLEFPDGVPVADTKHMTNGNTAPMFVLGGTQNDYFEVDHNRGMLYLAGDAGDDTFLLKTFLVLRENPNQPDEITNLTTLFGGTGSNRYEYLQNAPVEINGGSGFDTIIVDGTPLDDTFIVTSTYVAGAGRIVNFTNIEAIEVDGGGGNDNFWVLNTDPNLKITLNGGTGDDTFHIGGTPPALVFDPPPYTYTPPAYTVQLPPKVVYTDNAVTMSSFTLSFNIVDWFADGGSWNLGDTATVNAIASAILHSYVATLSALLSLSSLTSVSLTSIGGASASFAWDANSFLFLPAVQLTITGVVLDYRVGKLEQQTALIQPPSITVDPAPFAFLAPASLDASQVKGQLVIEGGSGFETDGDTVIYENENGAAQLVGAQKVNGSSQLLWIDTNGAE